MGFLETPAGGPTLFRGREGQTSQGREESTRRRGDWVVIDGMTGGPAARPAAVRSSARGRQCPDRYTPSMASVFRKAKQPSRQESKKKGPGKRMTDEGGAGEGGREVKAAKAKKARRAKEGGEEDEVGRKRRTTNPGVRVVSGRVYDSERGSTCHQCRQKTMDDKVQCTGEAAGAGKGGRGGEGRLCTVRFCRTCLKNRYGEDVDAARQTGTWRCPVCRDVCNCSQHQKKRGLDPTGILALLARSAGASSVADLLRMDPLATRMMKRSSAGATKDAARRGGDVRRLGSPRAPASASASASASATASAAAAVAGKRKRETATSRAVRPSPPLPPPSLQMARQPLPLPVRQVLPSMQRELVMVADFVARFGPGLGLPALPSAQSLEQALAREGRDPFLDDLHVRLLRLLGGGGVGTARVTASSWPAILAAHVGRSECVPPAAAGAVRRASSSRGAGYGGLGAGERLALLAWLCDEVASTCPAAGVALDAFVEAEASRAAAARAAARRAREREREDSASRRQLYLDWVAGKFGGAPRPARAEQAFDPALKARAAELEAAAGVAEAAVAEAGRLLPLGQDREGRRYWFSRPLGRVYAEPKGALAAGASDEGAGGPWSVVADEEAHLDVLLAALDLTHAHERPLRERLAALRASVEASMRRNRAESKSRAMD